MEKTGIDPLFVRVEREAYDFELFPSEDGFSTLDKKISGLLSREAIRNQVEYLQSLDVDTYVQLTVAPAESPIRPGLLDILDRCPWKLIQHEEVGPLVVEERVVPFSYGERKLGIIGQNRKVNNGVWMPEHHNLSCEFLQYFANYHIPVVTFIDTPGADAGEIANCNNQAHTISRLIANFTQVCIPTIGIILGNGYSGGAIPLASTNLILSVRDGVFNTIQPKGLANIARKYNLSWQECAKYVGVSAYELFEQGYIDGIIDFVPLEEEKLHHLWLAITTGLEAVEKQVIHQVLSDPELFEDLLTHYTQSLYRFGKPSSILKALQEQSSLPFPQHSGAVANLLEIAIRFIRSLHLRRKIHFTRLENYGILADVDIPKGDLVQRTAQENEAIFQKWLESPFEIKYDDELRRRWIKFADRKRYVGHKRSRVGQFFRGDPDTEWKKALHNLCIDYSFYLYNLWKDAARNNLFYLINFLQRTPSLPETSTPVSILDVISREDIKGPFIYYAQQLLMFDSFYDGIVNNLKEIAREGKSTNSISYQTMERLVNLGLESAISQYTSIASKLFKEPIQVQEMKDQFLSWLSLISSLARRTKFYKEIEQWKPLVFPRIPKPLLAVVSYILDTLLPSYLRCRERGKQSFIGRFDLQNIGIKDFWNRLEIAYQDLLIHETLQQMKKKMAKSPIPVHEQIIQWYFKDFEEINANLVTADPVNFPGFRLAIDEALKSKITPCSVITGFGTFEYNGKSQRMGVLISNNLFQAGAWDMAATEKFCKLLLECAYRQLPVVCFVSSGGMNTKEGAGALFSMAILNDRLNRFIRDHNLPVIFFGFGDCTGGAQASFVTHPLVQTYYFSGTNMPFAGQIVVPAYLPYYSTLSNYLSLRHGSMQGLVKNPFLPELDEILRSIDPEIPIPQESPEEVLAKVLEGEFKPRAPLEKPAEFVLDEASLRQPIKKVLIHARGCPCVKIVKKAIEQDYRVVLVQSDADMDSMAARLLRPRKDKLVCLGGNTPDESYLNARSVIKVAEKEKCDALHPGIGFLSENPSFAALCVSHGINFIGPSVSAMEWMGNKSNATRTARDLGIPVVPGSYGVLTSPESALELAEKIGFPVILKAVHGGGGKGIKVVRSPEGFRESFLQISAEARSAFGSGDIYLEKFIESMRHVEVQVLRDGYGNTKVLGLRDCSVQRNNQKIVEESGSTLLPEHLKQQAFESAAKLADAVDYVGAGTIEFIFSLKDQAIYFMEMNTRLQIEHPVTEAVTGVDIVKAQFDIASGRSIADLHWVEEGYAMEVRINAERPELQPDGSIVFIPAPGKVKTCRLPERDYIQYLSAVADNIEIPPYYDSMVIQLICKGKDRLDCIEKLSHYLEEMELTGVYTNIPVLKAILDDEVFRSGQYDTTFLPNFFKRIDLSSLIEKIENYCKVSKQRIDRSLISIPNSREVKVLSPNSAVFYRTPAPSEPEFVKVGDIISVDDTLCLLEAMKLFRPLTLAMYNQGDQVLYPPENQYKVIKINPANGQAVNPGDLLFILEPVS